MTHLRPAPFSKFLFGAAYYPEHWSPDFAERDAQRMQAAGFNCVRLAEFAWDMMEPVEGTFDFSFFDSAIELLAKYDIDVFLCTPTAAPPRWLTLKHPEVLRINNDGVPMWHGSRQHACHTNETFRDYCKKITQAMADHFHDNPHVIGWQTDNEFNCHFSECYCPSCQKAFADYLRESYVSIEDLNTRWGNCFWALTYADFSDIRLPHKDKPTHANPSHQLEQSRFISHCVSVFQKDQIDILRNANSNWIIFHNGIMNNIDYRGEFTEMLDVLGYDVYPMFHYDPEFRRVKHAFNLDLIRSYSGNFIIPEHQSGPGGQRPYFHNTPEPGEIRMMSWRSIARGADSLLYFRWRTCRFGAEEYWCGVLDHDDVPRRRYNEISQIGSEIKRIEPFFMGSSVKVDVAIATGDYNVEKSHYSYPMDTNKPDVVASFIHQYFYEEGYQVGGIHPDDDLSNVKLYFIPHWEYFTSEWVEKLEAFVANGGTLVIGARTGTRTTDNTITDKSFPGLLADLTGITVDEYGRQNKGDKRPLYIDVNGTDVLSTEWYEILKLDKASTFAMWSNRHQKDQPAISYKAHGKGHVLYVGTYLDTNLVRAMSPKLVELSGLTKPYPELPAAIECVTRVRGNEELLFLINGTDKDVTVDTLPHGTVLVGTADNVFKSYDVKIIKI